MQDEWYRCSMWGSWFLLSSDHQGSQGPKSRWSESRVTLSAKDIKVGEQDTAGYSYFLLNMSGASGSLPQFIPLTLFGLHPIKHSFNSEGKKKSIKRKKKKEAQQWIFNILYQIESWTRCRLMIRIKWWEEVQSVQLNWLQSPGFQDCIQ